MIDKLLERYGLKYEELTPEERKVVNTWTNILSQGSLTIDKVRENISSMRDAVVEKVTTTENNTKQDIFLKARLKNYNLILALLSTPEKARRAIEQQLESAVGMKKPIV